MRVPLSWLADHVDLGGVSSAVLADRLTFAGIEVERVERVGEDIAGVLTARVLDVRPHPAADRLALVTVEAGAEPLPLEVAVPEDGPPAAGLATVEVQDVEGCPLYVARVVEGLDAARPSPLRLARRLFLYGQRPLG